MREIVFDTETTGLDATSDRIIEIGGIELIDRFPTGRSFHVYINPEGREVHPEALAVHGISNADLTDKPVFGQIADDFLTFISGARLVAHNAGFDIGFVNAEFARIGQPAVDSARVVDTLAIARRKHPMGPNSLDFLCKRYGIDNSRRVKHGALLDAELLAEVYIELAGGKQAALHLMPEPGQAGVLDDRPGRTAAIAAQQRPQPLPPRLTQAELDAHQTLVDRLGADSLWKRLDTGG